LKTYRLNGEGFLRLETPHNPHLGLPDLQEAEAAGKPLHVNVDQQQLSQWSGSENVPIVYLLDVPYCDAYPDCSAGKE